MHDEPGIVRQARDMVAVYRRTDGAQPSLDDMEVLRTRLRSMAAHPATSVDVRERVLGVLLVVDVLVSAAEVRPLHRLAG